jgi:hypothetical protein
MDRIKTEVRVTSGWWMRTVVAADDDDLWIGGQDPRGLFVRLWRFRRHWEALNHGTTGCEPGQLVELGGV